MTNQAERRRHQPLLIVAEEGSSYANGGWTYEITLRNEGAGAAFRTTFGVDVAGRRCTYKARPSGPAGTGDVPRVLPADREKREYALIGVPGAPPAADGTNPNADRVYWTRCENALGETWSTANPISTDATAFVSRRESRWRPSRTGRARAPA